MCVFFKKGANTGIGRETARALASSNANVILGKKKKRQATKTLKFSHTPKP